METSTPLYDVTAIFRPRKQLETTKDCTWEHVLTLMADSRYDVQTIEKLAYSQESLRSSVESFYKGPIDG